MQNNRRILREVGTYEIGVATRKSLFHGHNEDAYRISPVGAFPLSIALLDGVGKPGRGSVCWYSRDLAHRAIEEMQVYESPRRALESLESYAILSDPGTERNHAATLLASIRRNVVTLAWKGDVMAWRKAGTSGAYLPLTSPHLDDDGTLLFCVGDGEIGRISSASSILRPEDILILCTDGVRVNDAVLATIDSLGSMQELANRLVDASPGGDDATAITVRCCIKE